MQALSWVLKKLWLLLAIVLVLVAVALSLLRYSLPYLPDLTQPLENELESRFQQPVSINDLSMAWTQQGPSIVLEDLSLSPANDAKVKFNVAQVYVVLNFWQSIVQQQFVADEFILDKANIAVDLRQLTDVPGNDTLDIDNLSELFLHQLEKFSIHQGQVFLTNLRGITRRIELERLSWVNEGSRHRAVGSLRMDDFATNALDIIVDLNGDTWSELTGQFYVNAQNIDISPWLEERLGDIDVQESDVNFTAWLDMQSGELFEGLLQLRQNRITWQYKGAGQTHWLDIPGGKVILRPQENGWLMNSLPMTLESSSGSVRIPRVAWQNKNSIHDISVSNVNLDDATSLLTLLPFTSQEVVKWVKRTGINGQVDGQYRLHPITGSQWRVDGTGLSIEGGNNTPSVSGLRMSVSQMNNQAQWHLYGSGVSVASRHLSSEHAWAINELDLSGTWIANDNGWSVSLTQMLAQVNDLTLQGSAQLSSDNASGKPSIESFIYSTAPFSVATARKLLPKAMGDGVHSYLSEAMHAGQLSGIEAVWRGDIDSFANDSLASVFSARAGFESLDFKFQPDWPVLEKAPIHLDFYQNTLLMYADKAVIGAVNVDNVFARIPDLTDGSIGLQIDAQASGDAQQVYNVFKNSPLDSVTETFNQLNPQGQVAGQVALDIPFDESREVGVFVEAPLAGVQVTVDAIKQRFSINEGKLTVNNGSVNTSDLILSWYGMPVTASVEGNPKNDGYELAINTELDWQTEPLFKQFPYDQWEEFFYGAVNGESRVTLQFIGDTMKVDAEGQYDLTGLETYLPSPLEKSFGEGWQFYFSLNGSGDNYTVTGRIDERARFEGSWRLDMPGWQKATLAVGEDSQIEDAGSGFTVLAELGDADIGRWYSLIYALGSGSSSVGVASAEAQNPWLPDSISVSANELKWAEQSFGAANIRSWPEANEWQVQVNSDKAVLNVGIPNEFMKKGIDVRADYLELSTDIELPSSDNDDEAKWDWLGKVPPVNVNCRSCRINEHNLGEVDLAISPIEASAQAKGFTIDRLNVTRNGDRIQANGVWRYENEQAYSELNGQLNTSDLGELLRQFGIETAIRDSSADINFSLNWDDHLHQPSWSSLDGNISWSLGKGYLAEVSDGGARIFSILSLDSILRKLTLDFRDIFSQGMFFTELSGSAAIEDGVAQTDDARLLGSAGDMDIRGWTDMTSGELNYTLTYAPKVTSSLPVILAWMVNPPSGLAALLIDKVLHDAKVISKLRYEVTGTIENPVVQEIERDSRPVDLPELEEDPKNPEVNDEEGATDSAANEQPF
ncbi:TIGR02099 family protein [Idiomarina piscisalsi]|uniref:TIGR02099 family protein n=1 Tax=Idiomarina piscisalsi TaxID=1096243 RepID=A0ABN5ASF0_9GAMM|nr:YhdP family protein [Idiomarina piscisalsi]ASG66585.1 TIGR02099 family protein [Idiomarina piscisalsi]